MREVAQVHKFPVLRDGVNQALLEDVRKKVDGYLAELFDGEDLVKVDGLVSFTFGSATIQVTA